MSQALNAFTPWFKNLTSIEKAEILRYLQNSEFRQDGFNAGPLPSQQPGRCPVCGK
jgi:hypothetical protein